MKIIPPASNSPNNSNTLFVSKKNKPDAQPVTQKSFFSPVKVFPLFMKSAFWFSVGVCLALFLLISFVLIYFQKKYTHVVYPGVIINGVNFGGKTPEEVKNYFSQRNTKFEDTKFVFTLNEDIATVSARQLSFGYDQDLLAQQAYSIGRSKDITSNISLIFQAYTQGVNLPPAYRYSEDVLTKSLAPIVEKNYVEPIDALFSFENDRVTAFRLSSEGQMANTKELEHQLLAKTYSIVSSKKPLTIVIPLPIKVLKPKVSTDEANKLGIRELVATGTSTFRGSIPSRIYNLTLAASRTNGLLVAPGEVFSFNKALGDVSAFTGYKQAYVIQNGRTVLGDGGGVCQVSTTLFRALLDSGLPIVERNAHAYRVGYYEQDAPPGYDATIYVPSIDLKFKNDTNSYILIQNYVNPDSEQIVFFLYGKKDGRQVSLAKPVISREFPPPEPLYQDDPTLPKGEVKQVDYPAAGATVIFSRQVTKAGKLIISDKFVSNYRPWQAVYLRGTKE